MASVSIFPPYPSFFDVAGKPLENGYIWIGTANLDPQTNPIAVYWDEALTITADQPIRTLGGYPVRNGTPAQVFPSAATYSMRVQDKNGIQQYYVAEASKFDDELASPTGSSLVGFLQSGTGAQPRTVQSKLRDTVSVKDFGAVGDGVTDDTAAIAACLLAAKTNGTLRVFFPVGTYNVSSPIVLNSYRGLTLYGEGYPVGATVGKCTYLRYTGSSGNLLTLNSCAAMEIRNIWFGYSNASYAGDLVATNNPSGLDTTNMTFVGCLFSGETLSQVNASSLLRLEKTINTQIERCQFQYAVRGVVFYGYCNIITFRSNMFLALGLKATYAYSGSNNTFAFYDNTFEPTRNYTVCPAFDTVAGVVMIGFVFKGNWLGDVGSPGGGYWVNLDTARGVDISSNHFATAGSGAGDYAIYLTSCLGVNISDNIFFDKAINFANASTGVVVANNFFGTASPQILGRGFVSQTSTWLSNYNLSGGGLPRSKAYKNANQSVASSTHTAVTFEVNVFDQGDVHSTSVNTTRFTVPVGGAGLWQLEATLMLASVACTYIIRLVKNGGTVVGVVSGLQSASVQVIVPITTTDVAADGDYYEVTYWQNSGVNQNVFGAVSTTVDSHMTAHKVMSGD